MEPPHGNARCKRNPEGDAVSVIRDLKVKGASPLVRRGSVFKAIHLSGDPELIKVRREEIKGLVACTGLVKTG